MPSISFMTITDYKATLKQDVGGLMFSGHLYDCESNVDKTKLRKDFKEELKGKRIHAVLIYTDESPKFSKEQNTLIKYKSPSVADEGQEGAFQLSKISRMWWSRHPMGDAIVVYIEPKPKTEKIDGVPSASELKKLRKECRYLKKDYDRLETSRPRAYSGEEYSGEEFWRRFKIHEAEHDAKKKTIMKEIYKRATVLIQHDTPFIQKQMEKWMEKWTKIDLE